MNDLIKYNDGEIELAVSVENETIWLTQKQIAELFDKDTRTINEHIKTIYKEEELTEISTIRNSRIVQKEGNREVSRDVLHYNLDVVISIGYRANSKKATKFRQWSTKVLKEYIVNGYAINTHKITEQRLLNLENDMQFVKSQIKNNEVEIYTQNILKQLLQAVEKYNKQYLNIELKNLNKFHDRFLLIDNNELYYIGVSLKDLGNKTFAFSKLNIDLFEFLGRLK